MDDILAQLAPLGLALLLGILVGAEREWQGKPAGMRTHALIAVGACLFVLAGRYGFGGIEPGTPGVDPARIAAQVVTGVGFLGAGVIFFHRNLLHGMTTAASIWSTTAVAIACGAGLYWAAVAVAVAQLVVVAGLAPVENVIARHARHTGRLRVRYSAPMKLRDLLAACTERGFNVTEIDNEDENGDTDGDGDSDARSTQLTLNGRGSIRDLTAHLTAKEGIERVKYQEEITNGGV
ncbi:MgtC/SapB family protein [Glycomyces harbinensis]|uniref:Putative Mg2+ transporter-C (MgtC) family protein n=1 Tax=Glycomyces harbinensis TaxID=58114 RepID=A0A1G7C928_9ACTN|nr:MgtC/SapB family protein [Glycomyces harbinensis]SDE35817.1 putative Mg2+ transporter-C (MgtC) family protein [Glycomyces harbinensis]